MGQVYNKIYTPEKWEKVNKENKELIDDYIKELKSQKKAEGTIKQYYSDLRIVAIWCLDNCDNRSMLELTKRDFRNLSLQCQEEYNMSNARVNRIFSSVRTILSFAEDDDELYEDYDRNVAAKIKGLPKDPQREVVFLPNDLIEELWQKLMDEERYKEATLLAILYDSGCRRNEIEQVERRSITPEGNATNPVRGKRGKIFKVLYFNHTKEAFLKYEDSRTDDSDKLFPAKESESSYMSIYEWVVGWRKDLKELTGKDYPINVHSFRHCFIEHMTDGTHWLCKELGLGRVPIEKVKTLAHHNDVSTTDSYRSNDEERDIADLLGIKI